MAATTIMNTPSQGLPFILQAPKDWEKYMEIKKTVMRKSGAWDQVNPEGTGPNLRRPHRPTPGYIVTNRRLDGLRLVLRATGGIAICQVIRLQVRKEECNV